VTSAATSARRTEQGIGHQFQGRSYAPPARGGLPDSRIETAGDTISEPEKETVELREEELEERIAPKLASNHNETFLVDR
jgi:hypothetical protein